MLPLFQSSPPPRFRVGLITLTAVLPAMRCHHLSAVTTTTGSFTSPPFQEVAELQGEVLDRPSFWLLVVPFSLSFLVAERVTDFLLCFPPSLGPFGLIDSSSFPLRSRRLCESLSLSPAFLHVAAHGAAICVRCSRPSRRPNFFPRLCMSIVFFLRCCFFTTTFCRDSISDAPSRHFFRCRRVSLRCWSFSPRQDIHIL